MLEFVREHDVENTAEKTQQIQCLVASREWGEKRRELDGLWLSSAK